MIAYFLNSRSEQNPLEKIKVLGDHGNHVNIPTFSKTLHRNFQFGAGKRMKAMLYINQVVM